MKTTKLFILAALSLIAASCAKEAQLVNETDTITVKAYTEGSNPATRTYMVTEDSKGYVYWKSGDVMGYKESGQAAKNVATSSVDESGNASFKIEVSDMSKNIIAVSPYDGNLKYDSSDEDVITHYLNPVQTATEGSFASELNPMIAKATGTSAEADGFAFKNIAGLFCFKVNSESVKYVQIKGNNSEKLAGNYSADYNDGTPTSTYADDALDYVKLEGSFATDTYYYIVTLPQTFSKGITITIEDENGVKNYSTDKEIVVERSKATSLGTLAKNVNDNIWSPADASDDAHTVSWHYAPGWSKIADPDDLVFDADEKTYTFTLPTATSDTWQAQMFITPTTPIVLSSENYYDFSVVITSSTAQSNATIKLYQDGNDGLYLFSENPISLAAGEATTISLTGLAGKDISSAKLLFDFGGNAANTKIVIKDITLKLGEENEVVPVEYDTDANLWKEFDPVAQSNLKVYYAPGWSVLDTWTYSASGSTYTITLPTATSAQWQAQFFLKPSSGPVLSASNTYTFQATLTSTTDLNMVTIKYMSETEAEIFYKTDTSLSAGVEKLVQYTGITGQDTNGSILLFDFGGNADNTTITIKEIVMMAE